MGPGALTGKGNFEQPDSTDSPGPDSTEPVDQEYGIHEVYRPPNGQKAAIEYVIPFPVVAEL